MTACNFCGRENEAASRFCIDCGKPMSACAARVVPAVSSGAVAKGPAGASLAAVSADTGPRGSPRDGAEIEPRLIPPTRVGSPASRCPKCAKPVDPALPFCAHCGAAVADPAKGTAACGGCGAAYVAGVDLFCARCGHRVGQRVSVEIQSVANGTMVLGAKSRETGPRVSLLGEDGQVKSSYTLDRGEAVLGRGDADITFEDVYLSPLHARLELREGELWLRDLGSRNGTWTFIEGPTKLADGDTVLVGSQLLRFRRLGYPGPHPPEADSTRRMGSLTPTADVAVLEQLRADGSVRDCFHLSPARTIQLGRESGDWVFPYDQTMSGRHAEIRSQDADFYVYDAGSRNGVALSVRGERPVRKGQRILLGDQVLRIESITT
jgi:pSer/pThr/pTyr-binding forkhead associated (FHA) protein